MKTYSVMITEFGPTRNDGVSITSIRPKVEDEPSLKNLGYSEPTTRGDPSLFESTNPKYVRKPETKDRDVWSNKYQFLLSCIGNAVGVGNVWRFPYLCYINGGGAFLVSFLVMFLVIGIPLFLLEMSLGQYSSLGPAHLYASLSPIFKGLGLASVIAAFIIGIYYNMIIAWTIYYFFESFNGPRWLSCNNYFNTATCTTIFSKNHSQSANSTIASEEFFNYYILNKSESIENVGSLDWKLTLILLTAWVIVFISLVKGIQSSGKVVYFTALFPYVILIILFVRGITLEGAMLGIRYYLVPNWERVKDPIVWRNAAVQVFYSLGIASGGMLTYASYNRFDNSIVKHTVLIALTDMLTSFFAGIVIFAMIGFMAFKVDKDVSEVVRHGIGLAFIAIPDGLSQLPGCMFWCLLYFFMLFLLGIDSQFAAIETITTFVFDSYHKIKPGRPVNKPLIVATLCTIMFFCGLPLCTRAGIYIFEIMDTYSAGFPFLIIAILEVLIVCYQYGSDNFLKDLQSMTGWKPSHWVRSHLVVVLSTVTPIVLFLILLSEIYGLVVSKSFENENLPKWSHYLGWALAVVPLTAIPAGMVHHFLTSSEEKFMDKVRDGFRVRESFHNNALRHSQRTTGTRESIGSCTFDNRGFI